MRISIDEEDLGYDPLAYKYCVYWNGIEVDDVITADEEQGFIIRNVTNEKGEYCINEETGFLKTERVYGLIRVVKV